MLRCSAVLEPLLQGCSPCRGEAASTLPGKGPAPWFLSPWVPSAKLVPEWDLPWGSPAFFCIFGVPWACAPPPWEGHG